MDIDLLKQELNKAAPDFNGDIVHFDLTDSTNRTAKEYAARGEECLVLAERQSAGRGRYNRGFVSEKGGLYMSVCLKVAKQRLEQFAAAGNEGNSAVAEQASPSHDATFALGERLIRYPVQAGEAVARALGTLFDEKFEIKLPNDILLNKKKVVGILIEAIHHDEDIFLVFGIGVNLENPLPKELDMAANLLDLTGKTVPAERVCAQIVREVTGIL